MAMTCSRLVEHDARQRDPVLVLHGVADHGEGVDGGLAVRGDVVGVC